jgi:hypothetical protein
VDGRGPNARCRVLERSPRAGWTAGFVPRRVRALAQRRAWRCRQSNAFRTVANCQDVALHPYQRVLSGSTPRSRAPYRSANPMRRGAPGSARPNGPRSWPRLPRGPGVRLGPRRDSSPAGLLPCFIPLDAARARERQPRIWISDVESHFVRKFTRVIDRFDDLHDRANFQRLAAALTRACLLVSRAARGPCAGGGNGTQPAVLTTYAPARQWPRANGSRSAARSQQARQLLPAAP